MNHLDRKKSGFTLIELLVVIAIIAILAAILFPVFAQARESARSISCLSSTRQFGMAMVQYTQDFDEYMPPAFDSGSDDPGQEWMFNLQPYLKVGITVQDAADGHSPCGAMGFTDPIYHCPSDTILNVNCGGPPSPELSYGVNAEATWRGCDPSNEAGCGGKPYEAPPLSLSTIQRPANVIFLGDGTHAWGPTWGSTAVDWIQVQTPGVDGATTDGDINGAQESLAIQQQFENDVQNTDYTDAHVTWQDTTPTWTDKGPAYRHHRNGEKTGLANIVFCDGHSQSEHFGALHVGNFFPRMTQDLPYGPQP